MAIFSLCIINVIFFYFSEISMNKTKFGKKSVLFDKNLIFD